MNAQAMVGDALVLAIDTCGPSGSVALARLDAGRVQLIGQAELAGRAYSATLVAAVGDLLAAANTQLAQLHAIVAVNGPGSFTGVRVGLSAVKGLAEGSAIGVIPVSRLEVLAAMAQVPCAALDAHRHQLFLRVAASGIADRELLAGREELAALPAPPRIAVCDQAAATLLQAAWPATGLVHVSPPSAADAIALCAPRVTAGQFADLALLDGHYLRRSDAEIFGAPGARRPSP